MQWQASFLKAGDLAPSFGLLNQAGQTILFPDVAIGKGCVLLFLASDFLPRDLALLRQYQSAYERFQQADVPLFALSGLNWERLYQLASRLDLPFSLLFDPCCRIAKRYQAMWIPKLVNQTVIYGVSAQGVVVFAEKNIAPELALRKLSGQTLDSSQTP